MDTASIDSMRDASTISVKWNHGGVFRRFALSLTEGDIYTALMTKIRAAVTGFNQQLAWKDEDGDDIIFATTLELEEPIAALKLGQPLRLHTVNYETPSQSTTPMTFQSPMQQEPPKVETERPPLYAPYAGSEDPKVRKLHRNVVCDVCDGAVCGRRFKCLQCPDYDLCEACESTGAHAEHTLIRIANPDDSAWQQFTRRRGHRHHHHFGPGGRWAPGCPRPATHPGGLPGQRPFDPFLGNLFNTFRMPQQQQQQATPGAEVPPPQQPHEAFRQNIGQGMDFLREVGAQVHQALANFGIDVDIDVEHHGQKEKVPPPQPAAAPEQPTAQQTQTPHNDVTMAEQQTEQPITVTNESQTTTTTTVTTTSTNDAAETPLLVTSMVQHHTGEPILVRIDDDESPEPEDWTMLHDHGSNGGGQPTAPSLEQPIVTQQPTAQLPPVQYPSLDQQQIIYHPDPRVNQTVMHLAAMGFDNEDGWLVRLAEAKRGDINAVLNALSGGGQRRA